MSKEELQSYAESMSSLCAKLLNLEERIEVLESERIVQKNVNELLRSRADNLANAVTELERGSLNNAQYLRRRQLEVSNVPANIGNEDLKQSISKFLSVTGTIVSEDDLDKCHRLKKASTVIMEFHSRTVRDNIIQTRKSMKDKTKRQVLTTMGFGKSYITESMCPAYRKIDYVCRKLKKDQLIAETWFFNGRLFVVDLNGKRLHIDHFNDVFKFADLKTVEAYLRKDEY